MLNSIGLANPGIDAFLADVLPRLLELGVPIWVSVGGFCGARLRRALRPPRRDEDVAAIELNVSCPNVESPVEDDGGDRRGGPRGRPRSRSTRSSRRPCPTSPRRGARGRRGRRGRALAREHAARPRARPAHAPAGRSRRATGGLSGPALRPVALAAVHACYAATGLPIVGMGGVETGRHALELIAAGASAVRARHRALPRPRQRPPECGPSWPTRRRARLATVRRSAGVAHGDAHGAVASADKNTCKSCDKPQHLRSARLVLESRAMQASRTQVQAPLRSLDQRMDALRRANEIRVRRAQLKKDLKAGLVRIEEILREPPEYVETAKVIDILMAVPKFGRVKAARFLNQCRISQSKTVGGPLGAAAHRARGPASPLTGPRPGARRRARAARPALRGHRAVGRRQGNADPPRSSRGGRTSRWPSRPRRAPRRAGEEDGREYHFLSDGGVRRAGRRAASSSSTSSTSRATGTGR